MDEGRDALKPSEPNGPDRRSQDIWRRVRGEYLELPGLSLEVGQAARLFGLEPGEAGRVLETLAESGFLRHTALGGFVRNDSRP